MTYTATTPCSATTKAGAPCRGTAGPNGFCRAHDPALYEEMQAARRRGGRPRKDPSAPQAPDLTTGPKIIATLDRAAKAMASGIISANHASALAALGRLALATLERDQGERLARLEKIAAAQAPQTIGRRR